MVSREKGELRVLHVIGSGTIGGAENFVYQLARFQQTQDSGITPAILFRKGKGHFFDKALAEGINVFSCPEQLTLAAIRETTQLMKSFDILHFHGLYPGLFLSAALSGTAVLYYIHGARALTKTMHEVVKNAFSTVEQRRLPTLQGARRFLKRQWFRFFLLHIARAIHAPSNFYVQFYTKTYGIPKAKMRRLPLGVNLAELKPHKPAEKLREELAINNEKVIGCVSTFRGLKRIDRLVEGFVDLIKRNSFLKFRLLLVGDGLERANIESLIEEQGIQDQALLTGMRNDVPDLLNVMDIFVLPSEFESYSIATVEAMFCGKPVLAFEGSGGLEEIVRESGGGIIVKDEGELADKLGELLTDEAKVAELGMRGRAFANEHCSIESFAETIGMVYRELTCSAPAVTELHGC